MRISLIAALAAATALIPVTANAQSRHDRGAWSHDGRSAHDRAATRSPARPARPAVERARPERPRPIASRDGARSSHVQVGSNRGDRGDRGGFADRDRPRPAQRADGGWHAQAGGQDHREWRGGDRNRDRGTRQQHVDRDRGPGNWQQRGTRDRDSRNWQQHRNDGRDWNRGDRDWRDRGRNDRHGNFDRNWRRDRRYDWRDYRVRNRSAYRLPRYYAPHGWHYGYRRFGIGYTLNSILFGSSYWITDPWEYRLPPAYGPYRWVRYYNDALLVDIYSGTVVDVVYGIFW